MATSSSTTSHSTTSHSTTGAAKKTTTDAKKTATDARRTARSASKDVQAKARRTRTQAHKAGEGIATHSKRIVGAAQTEVQAVASQPQRPLLFALGMIDRTASGVKALPQTLFTSPSRAREVVVDVAASAGDLAERAQRGYTEIAEDGESLVRKIRRQESTQTAIKYAERAQSRGERAFKDTEKAVEAGTQAVEDALSKIGS